MMKTDISLFTKKFCAAIDFARYPRRRPCHGSKIRASDRALHWRFLDNSGGAAIELAFLAPVLLFIIARDRRVALALGNYMTLENAVDAGARQLSIGRGDATPLTDTQRQFAAASGTLNASE